MIFERTEASRRKARAGFTLVELLVVIAIISVLAAMLMPALGKAMASARSISCQNNLKQLYLATAMYAGDYNNYIPAAAMGSGGPGISTNWYDIRWAMQLPPYLGGNKPATQPWYTTTECQKCPAFYSFYPDADRTVSAANTYAIAHWFSTYNMTLPWPKMNSPRYPHPANTPLYVDGAQSDTQPYMSYWHVDHEGVNRIGLHHGGKTNVLFFDSHVKPIHASSLDNWNWSSYNAP